MWSSADRANRGPRLWFRETPDGIVSRSMVWVGWLLVACGVALLTIGLTALSKGGAVWVPLTVGGGFTVGGVLYALSHHTFALNWSQRTWHETQRILCWTTKDHQGTFEDFAAVVLSEHRKPGSLRPLRFWVIGLTFRDMPVVVDLFLFSNREKAREKFHTLEHKMRLPAMDTGEQ